MQSNYSDTRKAKNGLHLFLFLGVSLGVAFGLFRANINQGLALGALAGLLVMGSLVGMGLGELTHLLNPPSRPQDSSHDR